MWSGIKLGVTGGLAAIWTGRTSSYIGTSSYIWNGSLTHFKYKAGYGWHTFRVEVRGAKITFAIDGRVVGHVSDKHDLSVSRIGIFADDAVLHDSHFDPSVSP